MPGDGWEDVTDPSEMKKVLGVGGMNRVLKGQGAPQQAGTTLTGNSRNLSLQKIKSLEALRRQAVTAASIYNQAFRRGSGRSPIAEYMPAMMNDANAKYDAAIDGLAPLARAAFRVPGSGADSDKESQAFMNVVPSRYTNDAGAKQKYQQMLQIIDGSIAGQREALGTPAPTHPQAPPNRGFKVIR